MSEPTSRDESGLTTAELRMMRHLYPYDWHERQIARNEFIRALRGMIDERIWMHQPSAAPAAQSEEEWLRKIERIIASCTNVNLGHVQAAREIDARYRAREAERLRELDAERIRLRTALENAGYEIGKLRTFPVSHVTLQGIFERIRAALAKVQNA